MFIKILVSICKTHTHSFTQPGCDKNQFLSGVKLVLIQSFPSPRLVA